MDQVKSHLYDFKVDFMAEVRQLILKGDGNKRGLTSTQMLLNRSSEKIFERQEASEAHKRPQEFQGLSANVESRLVHMEEMLVLYF